MTARPGVPITTSSTSGRSSPAAAAFVAASSLFVTAAHAQAPVEAPNVVPISASLVTSGQPPAAELGRLKEKGFEAVIYLAPPTVSDAVKDEALIVARQGITFINIPVRFDNPTSADFEQFAAVLKALGPRKVLVHCQVNMRASAFTFLYRTTVLKQDAREAYRDVSRIWTPHHVWKEMIEGELRKNGIAFEIL